MLWIYLKYKVETLLSRGLNVEITTQLSFNADAVISWIKRVRHLGINVPIRIGIPSPSSLGDMLNFARQCRVSTSIQLLQRYGWQVSYFLGTVGPEKFLGSLIKKLE
ncbi:hypothetical protein EKG40_08035 [Pseudomonas moorei]|nr:hypothetical protein EKG40_08035 [Pseudomonas moorei]